MIANNRKKKKKNTRRKKADKCDDERKNFVTISRNWEVKLHFTNFEETNLGYKSRTINLVWEKKFNVKLVKIKTVCIFLEFYL